MFTQNFIHECLKLHNDYRARHRSPPLTIDPKLNRYAQEWAINLTKLGKLQHQTNSNYGENLYSARIADKKWQIQPQDPVKSWYDEINYYRFGENDPINFEKVGHFTQLVWKGSTSLGVGMAIGPDNTVYVVCNYEPAGNVTSQFATNVLREWLRQEDTGKPRGSIVQKDADRVQSRIDWLSKIVCITDEWDKWLLSHIDLILRLSEYLKTLEQVRAEPGELETVSQDENGEILESVIKDEEKFLYEGEEDEFSSIEYPRIEKNVEQGSLSYSMTVDDNLPINFPEISFPRTKEEMLDLLEKFTEQAMIYYDYYNRWKKNVEGNERIRFTVEPTLEKIQTKNQVLYFDMTKVLPDEEKHC